MHRTLYETFLPKEDQFEFKRFNRLLGPDNLDQRKKFIANYLRLNQRQKLEVVVLSQSSQDLNSLIRSMQSRVQEQAAELQVLQQRIKIDKHNEIILKEIQQTKATLKALKSEIKDLQKELKDRNREFKALENSKIGSSNYLGHYLKLPPLDRDNILAPERLTTTVRTANTYAVVESLQRKLVNRIFPLSKSESQRYKNELSRIANSYALTENLRRPYSERNEQEKRMFAVLFKHATLENRQNWLSRQSLNDLEQIEKIPMLAGDSTIKEAVDQKRQDINSLANPNHFNGPSFVTGFLQLHHNERDIVMNHHTLPNIKMFIQKLEQMQQDPKYNEMVSEITRTMEELMWYKDSRQKEHAKAVVERILNTNSKTGESDLQKISQHAKKALSNPSREVLSITRENGKFKLELNSQFVTSNQKGPTFETISKDRFIEHAVENMQKTLNELKSLEDNFNDPKIRRSYAESLVSLPGFYQSDVIAESKLKPEQINSLMTELNEMQAQMRSEGERRKVSQTIAIVQSTHESYYRRFGW